MPDVGAVTNREETTSWGYNEWRASEGAAMPSDNNKDEGKPTSEQEGSGWSLAPAEAPKYEAQKWSVPAGYGYMNYLGPSWGSLVQSRMGIPSVGAGVGLGAYGDVQPPPPQWNLPNSTSSSNRWNNSFAYRDMDTGRGGLPIEKPVPSNGELSWMNYTGEPDSWTNVPRNAPVQPNVYYNFIPGSKRYTTNPYNLTADQSGSVIVNDSGRVKENDAWVKSNRQLSGEWIRDANGNYKWYMPGIEQVKFGEWTRDPQSGMYEYTTAPVIKPREMPDTIISQAGRVVQQQIPGKLPPAPGGYGKKPLPPRYSGGGGGGGGGRGGRGGGGGYGQPAGWYLGLMNWRV